MVFDIPKQALQCVHCGTVLPVTEYSQNNAAYYSSDTYQANLYTCRSCGAELIAPDEQTVAYCAYCGGEAFLNQKDTPLTKPQRIIPFKRSKDSAKSAYAAALKNKLYVPKQLKQGEFLESFHGIYLPYWSFDAHIPERQVFLEGHKSYTKGRYDYHEDYAINVQLGGSVSGLSYDASEAFDDTIANEIAPFDRKDERPFEEGYLAGFYSDRPTTDVRIYQEEARQAAADAVIKEVEMHTVGITVSQPKNGTGLQGITPDGMMTSVSLFPVWFLTWRKGDRVAYSVMNGQSGKMSMDLPVDRKKFFLVSLLAAVVLFAMLSIASGFILPKIAAVVSAIFLLISSITLHGELKQIYIKENHIYDYGDTKSRAKKGRRRTGYTAKKSGGTSFNAAIIIGICMVVFPSIGWTFFKGLLGKGNAVFMITLIVQLIFSVKTILKTSGVAKKTAVIPAIIAPLVLTAGLVIFGSNPAADYWYYGTAIGCLVGMIVNCLSAINYFNYLTTRPVPNFFRRGGANNAAH